MNFRQYQIKLTLIIPIVYVALFGELYTYQNSENYIGCKDTYASTQFTETNFANSNIIRIEN